MSDDNKEGAGVPVALDRYNEVDHGGMRWHTQGEWVRYEDVAAIAAVPAVMPAAPSDAVNATIIYGQLTDEARRRTSRENVEDVLAALSQTMQPQAEPSDAVTPTQACDAWNELLTLTSGMSYEARDRIRVCAKIFAQRQYEAGLSQAMMGPSGAVTDEQIERIATIAHAENRLPWVGFKADADGRYTIPVLSQADIALVRAVLAARIQPAAAGEQAGAVAQVVPMSGGKKGLVFYDAKAASHTPIGTKLYAAPGAAIAAREQEIISRFLEETGQYVTNDASREAAIAAAVSEIRTSDYSEGYRDGYSKGLIADREYTYRIGRLGGISRPEMHPATADLVMRFGDALRDKLAAAEKKYGYSDGWLQADWMDECRAKLLEHVAKGDPRDVAAYCAFLWHHGESTALTQPTTVQQAETLTPDDLFGVIRGTGYVTRGQAQEITELVLSALKGMQPGERKEGA